MFVLFWFVFRVFFVFFIALCDWGEVLSNGNVITPQDVLHNLEFTKADGVMSAEGLLDCPALFAPCLDGDGDGDGPEPAVGAAAATTTAAEDGSTDDGDDRVFKLRRKLTKKLREVEDFTKRGAQPRLDRAQAEAVLACIENSLRHPQVLAALHPKLTPVAQRWADGVIKAPQSATTKYG